MNEVLIQTFNKAKEMSPSTIVIDNIDEFLSKSKTPWDEEVKFELLSLIDKINDMVKICAATSKPFDLDPSSLRRFDLKAYVKSPNDKEVS